MRYTLASIEGLNNKAAHESLFTFDRFGNGTSKAEVAVNVDFSSTGKVARRVGFTLGLAGEAHSLWATQAADQCFAVRGGVLGALDDSFQFYPLLSCGDRPMVYDQATDGRVYATNGDGFFRIYGDVATRIEQVGTYDFDPHTLPRAGDGEQYDSPPAGQCLCIVGPYLFVARDSVVWRSRAWAYEQVDMTKDFLPFPDTVTMVRGAETGVYVGTEKEVYFLSSPASGMRVERVCAFGAVPGTDLRCDGADFKGDLAGKVVVWESKYGKMLGTNTGSVSRLIDREVSYAVGEAGAALIRHQNGEAHHLTVFRNPSGEGSNMRTTDTAEATIIRKGVII